ncbi:MAG: globin domain-containing protein [Alphaproteobacteria bacterium]|nr:globin domain-containing protein [Alphaproteobacteria bacterium]
MTPAQIAVVKESFAKVVPIKETAAELFYNRLFELDPSLKRLFHTDMKEQGQKLMATLAVAVGGLDNLDAIIPVVRDLGARHVGYGVEEAHYETVGTALIWTLEQGLGDDFTNQTKEAWLAAYGLLTSVMIEGGEGAAA